MPRKKDGWRLIQHTGNYFLRLSERHWHRGLFGEMHRHIIKPVD
jgi:hypothetical protein